jgi:hypothetical protein
MPSVLGLGTEDSTNTNAHSGGQKRRPSGAKKVDESTLLYSLKPALFPPGLAGGQNGGNAAGVLRQTRGSRTWLKDKDTARTGVCPLAASRKVRSLPATLEVCT